MCFGPMPKPSPTWGPSGRPSDTGPMPIEGPDNPGGRPIMPRGIPPSWPVKPAGPMPIEGPNNPGGGPITPRGVPTNQIPIDQAPDYPQPSANPWTGGLIGGFLPAIAGAIGSAAQPRNLGRGPGSGLISGLDPLRKKGMIGGAIGT